MSICSCFHTDKETLEGNKRNYLKNSSFLLGGEGSKYENKTGVEYFSLGAFS